MSDITVHYAGKQRVNKWMIEIIVRLKLKLLLFFFANLLNTEATAILVGQTKQPVALVLLLCTHKSWSWSLGASGSLINKSLIITISLLLTWLCVVVLTILSSREWSD